MTPVALCLALVALQAAGSAVAPSASKRIPQLLASGGGRAAASELASLLEALDIPTDRAVQGSLSPQLAASSIALDLPETVVAGEPAHGPADSAERVTLRLFFHDPLTYRDVLSLLDEGLDIVDIPDGASVLVRVHPSSWARLSELPSVSDVGRFEADVIAPDSSVDGVRRVFVQSLIGDTAEARHDLETAGARIGRFEPSGRFYDVLAPSSLSLHIRDSWWVQKVVDIGEYGRRRSQGLEPAPQPSDEAMTMYADTTQRLSQRAEAEGKEIVARWSRDGVLFVRLSDGSYGAVVPAAPSGGIAFGTVPAEAPDFVVFDENEVVRRPFFSLLASSTFLATHDTYVTSVSPSSAFGSQQGFLVGKYGGTQLGMVRTSGFYVDGTITNAQLELYQESCTGGPASVAVEAHRISGSTWTETAATWNAYPAYQASIDYTLNFTGCPSNGWWPWDVTSTASSWNSGSASNYGHLLKYPTSAATGSAIGYSTKETSAARTPDYYIVYTAVTACTYTLNYTSISTPYSGGTGALNVTGTPSGCSGSWSATKDVSWITLTGTTSGSGSGTTVINYSVSANTGAARTGHITVSGAGTLTITQDAAPVSCGFTLNYSSISTPYSGGTGALNVTGSPAGCTGSWNASSDASWLTLTGTTSGSGAGTTVINYSVSANSGSARTGHITVSGAGTLTVTQDSAPCGFSLSTTTASMGSGGGSGSVNVIGAPSGCPGSWSASSDASWLTLTGTTSGSGSGTVSVSYSVAANTGGTRTAHINFSWGGTLTVTQSGPTACSFTLNYTTISTPYGGGTGALNVTGSPAGCAGSWNASSDASWLTLTGTTSGSGAGTTVINYSVSANSGSVRTGHITVSGAGTLTVTQDSAPCGFSLSTTTASVGSSGGSGSVNVIGAPSGCPGSWSASSDAAWLTLTGTTSGSGSGTISVSYSVAANTGGTRTAHINFSWGGTLTVTQSGPTACSFTLNYTTISTPYGGGTGALNVTGSPAGCAGSWSASSDASWLTLTGTTSGSGAGTTVINYSISANGGSLRTGHITVSGAGTLTVTQDSAPCGFSLSTTTASVGSSGGTGSVNVIGAPSGCPGSWSASSDAAWLTLTGTTSGNGSGTVSVAYSVAANTGGGRTAHITFSWGGTLTVTQSGVSGCTFTLNYTTISTPYGGGTGALNVTGSPAGCAGSWSASSDTSWLTLTGTTSGSGAGTTVISYSVSANSGSLRTGHITVSGAGTLTVTQDSAPCGFSLSTTTASVGSSGGPGSVNVIGAPSGCPGSWSASSDASWLTLTGTSSGSGSGAIPVAYSVAANTGGDRTAHINFSWGGTLTVTQSGVSGCTFTLSPSSGSAPYTGGTGSFAVTGSPTGCTGSWSASSDSGWLTLTGSTSGSGAGSTTVGYAAAANAGAVRIAHINLSSGAVFTLSQAAGVVPPSTSLAFGPGSLCAGQSVTVPVSLAGSVRPLSIQFDVTFDPSVVSVTKVEVGSLTTGFAISSNPSSGRIRVALASGTQASASSGEVARITFQSLGGPAQNGSTGIGIENASVNDLASNGSSSTLSCPSIRKGDVNRNGQVTAYDASLVLQAVVGAITLDSSQSWAADFNDNGAVTAYDASLILQCVVTGTCQ